MGMMATDETYNGWPNYETWCTALWLDNEEGTYHAYRAVLLEGFDRDEEHDSNLGMMAQLLEGFVTVELLESAVSGTGLASDLIGRAAGRIDWYRITEHYLEELEDELADELIRERKELEEEELEQECSVLIELEERGFGAELIGTCSADGRPIYRSRMAGTIYHVSREELEET